MRQIKDGLSFLRITYQSEDLYLQKKSDYSYMFLLLVAMYSVLVYILSQVTLGFNYIETIQIIIWTLIVVFLFYLIKVKQLTVAINIFMILGLLKAFDLLSKEFSLHFFIQVALVIFIVGAIHTKKYQLFSSSIIGYIFMVTSSFLPQASTLYTTPTELYVFRSTMILGGGMYIICVHYLSALIDREILKGKEYHIKRRIDTLTNLGNRFSFYESFERLDESKSACLMILDIDHFKQVNDQYGHHIGDVVLKQFGMILREVVHDQHIFRIGGEEFAVLLDDCSEQAQTDVASNINSKIADFTFDKDIKITVSIGCRFTDEGWSKENIYKYYKDADDCLYKAKNTGRNKVIYYK